MSESCRGPCLTYIGCCQVQSNVSYLEVAQLLFRTVRDRRRWHSIRTLQGHVTFGFQFGSVLSNSLLNQLEMLSHSDTLVTVKLRTSGANKTCSSAGNNLLAVFVGPKMK